MNEDGHTSSVRDKILSIRVKKGWKQGTRITFPEEGDQGPNTIPADISKFAYRIEMIHNYDSFFSLCIEREGA